MLVRLGRIFSRFFVTSVEMRELRNPNACSGDGEILGAGSGGKESDEGKSFEPIQPNFIAASGPPVLVHVLPLSLPLSLCSVSLHLS